MAVLVFIEHDGQLIDPAVLNTITAAKAIDADVHALVAGPQAIADAATKIEGVAKVLHSDAGHYEHLLAEQVAPLIAKAAEGYSHLLAPASTTGKNIMPRVAAVLDVAPISDIIGIESADTFKRPIYAGNAIATVQSSDEKKVITVRKVAFDAANPEGGSAAIESLGATEASDLSEFVNQEVTASERPDLTSANKVVSGGRGVGSAENFDLIFKVADKIGAAVGASRAAVDSGYAPNDWQVGQTGKVVAPELYIAVGISGAIQHLAGMKDSKVIVAINKDENAPIFEIADYGLVADLFKALPELEAQL